MCGITGIFDTRAARPVAERVLQRMNQAQQHRGPDESSVHLEPGVGLGHRRLSIIDLATGQQPLFNEDGSVVIVYNGEIYNYQELIPELQALGHVFHTKSDTEVIVHAWEAWGEDCVRALSRHVRVRAVGPQPPVACSWRATGWASSRCTTRCSTTACCCSVPSSSRCSPTAASSSRSIRCAVEEYFALGYVPEPRTIFKQARKLPPAHTLVIRRGQPVPEPQEYWDVRFTLDSRISEADAEAELIRLLDESVKLRMISEVPLGAFLSGGVDSSAVVAADGAPVGRPGQHLLDRLRRPGIQRVARSRAWWPSAIGPAISSRPCAATTST